MYIDTYLLLGLQPAPKLFNALGNLPSWIGDQQGVVTLSLHYLAT